MLRTVLKIAVTDVLQLGNDPRLFRVVAVELSRSGPDARCKVLLRSMSDDAEVMLVRGGRELVQIVLNPPLAEPGRFLPVQPPTVPG